MSDSTDLAHPTLADVLKLSAFRAGAPLLLAGRTGLSQIVRWAHSAELTDIGRLLRTGDLVLTTGLALPEDRAPIANYIGELADAGAVGLVVELGRRWSVLPTAYVESCDERGFPLIVLRREIPFATIIEDVGKLVADDQLAELRSSEEIHRTFNALSLSGATFSQILCEVHRMSGLSVVLENLHGQVLGFELGPDGREGFFSDWTRRSGAVQRTKSTSYSADVGWLTARVGARGDDWGRLILFSPATPSRRDIEIIERGAATLALERLAARDQDSLERQAHRALLGVLRDAAASGAEIEMKCHAAGFPLEERDFTGLVVRVFPDSLGSLNPTTPAAVREIAELTARTARVFGLAALVAIEEGGVTALASHPRTPSGHPLEEFASEIRRGAERSLRPTTVIVAAGTTVKQITGTARSLREAHIVADAASRRKANPHRSLHRLESVHLRGLLYLLGDDDRVLDFAARELEPVINYDQAAGSDLMSTLRAYVENRGNKSVAASAMHISRPAFYERMSRMQRLLGVDFDDAETLTSLAVALMILDIVSGDRDHIGGGPLHRHPG